MVSKFWSLILWRIYVLFLFVPLQGVLWFQSFVSSYVFVPLQRVAVEVFLPRRLPGHGPHRGGQTGGVQELQEVWIHDEPHADFNHRHPVYKRFCKIGVLLHFLLYLKKEISIWVYIKKTTGTIITGKHHNFCAQWTCVLLVCTNISDYQFLIAGDPGHSHEHQSGVVCRGHSALDHQPRGFHQYGPWSVATGGCHH